MTLPLGRTPYKAWYKRKLDLSYLWVLRCTAYVHTLKEIRKKLKNHSKKCVLVGFSGSNIYRVWDPEKADVIQAQDVIFDEDFQMEPLILTEREVGEEIIEPSLIAQSQQLQPPDATITNTTDDIDQVGVHLELIEPIEMAEQ